MVGLDVVLGVVGPGADEGNANPPACKCKMSIELLHTKMKLTQDMKEANLPTGL